jgi:hypothetical protein
MACRRLITPAWLRANFSNRGGTSLAMSPSMATGTDDPFLPPD